ncbi:terminase small subunit [Desulfovibrio mangrovi]|uniref:terminase small subunit n=1 Tax=Desulfovibrio mangrovi TaxID=2976983 RepID=UPI002247E0B3|nr:terminase small subunit [Desulfovibrio mangrovi]UZP67367.1 terminase small subunit [Desulfovibrio mangrovi]
MSRLTPQQKRFAEEYLIDLDADAAARRAGYSEAGCRRAAVRNMRHAGVREAIREAREQRIERVQVTQDMVLRELAAIGFTTMADVCRWSGDSLELLDSGSLSTEQAAAIAEITETTTSRGGTVRVKLHSKLKALEMLARHVGLYEERTDDAEPAADACLPVISPELREKLDAMYGVSRICGGGDREADRQTGRVEDVAVPKNGGMASAHEPSLAAVKRKRPSSERGGGRFGEENAGGHEEGFEDEPDWDSFGSGDDGDF